MKTYLRISSLIFLLVGVAHTLRIVNDIPVLVDGSSMPDGCSWAAASIAYMLFLFGFGLNWAFGRRDKRLRLREEELSSLIAILQDGRKQQMALLEMLQVQSPSLEPSDPADE